MLDDALWQTFALRSGGVWILVAEKDEVREEMVEQLSASVLGPVVVGGILLALGGGLPISPYVTTISFLIWLVCRIVGGRRESRGGGRTGRGGGTGRPQAAPVPSTTTEA